MDIKLHIPEPGGQQRDMLTLGVPRGRVERSPGAQAAYACSSHRLDDATQALPAPGTESSGHLLLLSLGFHRPEPLSPVSRPTPINLKTVFPWHPMSSLIQLWSQGNTVLRSLGRTTITKSLKSNEFSQTSAFRRSVLFPTHFKNLRTH